MSLTLGSAFGDDDIYVCAHCRHYLDCVREKDTKSNGCTRFEAISSD